MRLLSIVVSFYKVNVEFTGPRFSADGRSIRFLLEDSGENQLAQIELATGKLERLTSGPRAVWGFDHSGDGQTVVLSSEPQLPPEVFSLSAGRLAQLSHANEDLLRQIKLAKVENVHFPSRDGTEIEGFLFLPPDYSRSLRLPGCYP